MSDEEALVQASPIQASNTQEAVLEDGSIASGVEILPQTEDAETAASPSTAAEVVEAGEVDPYLIIELGDTIQIDSSKYKGTVIGQVYYRDFQLVRVMPLGAPDRLYDFSWVYDESAGIDAFADEVGVSSSAILEKHPPSADAFVVQQGFIVGQLVDAIAATGEIVGQYQIVRVDADADRLDLQRICGFQGDVGRLETIDFAFRGIPLDLPFVILSIAAAPPDTRPEADEEAQTAVREAEAAAVGVTGVIPRSIPVTGNVDPSFAVDDAEAAAAAAAVPKPKVRVIGTVTLLRREVYKEESEHTRVYSDTVQRADAMNDFFNAMSLESQKDPKAQRLTRLLVEALFLLKQDIVIYNTQDGTPRGVRAVSARTLQDLFDRTRVPMCRPVLDRQIRLYRIRVPEGTGGGQEEDIIRTTEEWLAGKVIEETPEYVILDTAVEQYERAHFVAPQTGFADAVVGSDVATPPFLTRLQSYITTFEQPTRRNPGTPPVWSFRAGDGEYFRRAPPDLGGAAVQGYGSGEGEKTPELEVAPLPFSLRRGVSYTWINDVRRDAQDRQFILVPPDAAPVSYYVLFPLSEVRDIGSPRSGLLALDSARGQESPSTMREILKKHGGGPAAAPTADDILAIRATLGVGEPGPLGGNIPLEDYIEGLVRSYPMALGMGDYLDLFLQTGLDRLELTPPIVQTLTRLLRANQAHITMYLQEARMELSSVAPVPIAQQGLLPKEDYDRLKTALLNSPLLMDDIRRSGLNTDAASDITLFAYLLSHWPDLTQAVLGGQKDIISIESYRADRDRFMATLRMMQMARMKELFRGEAPRPNPCSHVKKLAAIRKIQNKNRDDPAEYFPVLAKWFSRYQGGREGNWIQCSDCKQHLMCVHERILMQMFLNPRERDILYKELLMKFSGGVFGGRYICRNCGQSIQELAYDTHMEFSDDGVPIVGRAEIVDYEAILNDQVDEMLDDATSTLLERQREKRVGADEEKKMYVSSEMNRLYDVVKDLADRVGVPLQKEGYTAVIRQVMQYMKTLPSASQYAAEIKRRRTRTKEAAGAAGAAGAAAAAATGLDAPGAAAVDYAVYIARREVAAVAVYLLLHVQSHIPDYTIRYVLQGCKPGFGGYPLQEGPTTEGATAEAALAAADQTGLQYMNCAVGSIRFNKAPWNLTGFQKEASDVRRTKAIGTVMQSVLMAAVKQSTVQDALAQKRVYLRETLGLTEAGRARDEVSPFFLPEQTVITAAEAAEAAVVPEAAATAAEAAATAPTTAKQRTARGTVTALARLWIHQAHLLARQTAKLERHSPFSDTVCCFAPLTAPDLFWREHGMPVLPPRRIRPAYSTPFLQFNYVPRPMAAIAVAHNNALNYRLFLQVCFQGPRKGRPHEPGLTNLCAWCGLQFPENPHVIDVEKTGPSVIAANTAIKTDSDAFQDLLDTVHQLNTLPPRPPLLAETARQALGELAAMRPSPFLEDNETVEGGDAWKGLIDRLLTQLAALPIDAREDKVAEANGDLSVVASEMLETFVRRFTDTRSLSTAQLQRIIQRIISLPWAKFCQAVEMFLVPIQRLLTAFDADQFSGLIIDAELGDDTIKDYKNILSTHLVVVRTFKDRVAKSTYIQGILELMAKQYAATLRLRGRLTDLFLPLGRTFEYLKLALLMGPLAGAIARIQVGVRAADTDNLLKVLQALFIRYDEETRNILMTQEEIRQRIVDRNEKEKANIIREFDVMADEERKVALVMKRMRIGRWAMGGTKAVYIYDANQYEKDKEERARAGINDMDASEVAGMLAENDAGYDHEQFDEDEN